MSKALMYSRDSCPYCVKAKEKLKSENIEFKIKCISVNFSKDQMISEIYKKSGVTVDTVPQIFIDEKYIGGYDDLLVHLDKEESDDIDLSGFEL